MELTQQDITAIKEALQPEMAMRPDQYSQVILEMKEMTKALVAQNTALKNNPASLSLGNTPALQGPLPGNVANGGLFSAPGVRPDRFSAMPRVRTMTNLLRPMPNDIFNEILSIVTGATASIGSNPTDYCGTPAQPGALKQCEQQFKYGKYYMKSALQSINDIGYLRNRADVPGQILNSAPEDYPLMPDIMWRIVDTRSVAQYAFYLQGIALERSLEPVMILGDNTKANTNTTLGWISEFKGLDLQIKTGYTDTSGVTCPAADSQVIGFNTTITGTIGGGDGRSITAAIIDLWYAAQDRAEQVGMGDTQFAFLMRKEMFRALTDVYANTYATARFPAASVSAGLPLVQMAIETNRIREEMLNGHYLIVEGQNVPVFFSEGIPLEGQGNNAYLADLYLVPISWAGRPLLRLEYFNLNNQYINEWVGTIAQDRRRVLNNGLFAMGYNAQNFCDELLFASVMRLILETPFLAGRIDNIIFTYLANTRNAIPSESLYVDGGTSYYVPRAV